MEPTETHKAIEWLRRQNYADNAVLALQQRLARGQHMDTALSAVTGRTRKDMRKLIARNFDITT
jgi:hypothetical protein